MASRSPRRQFRNLELFRSRVPKHFGGSHLRGNAKTQRPLSTKHGLHLILKSEIARGERSLLRTKNASRIDAIIRKQAKRFGVRIYHFVNVGNHLHLVLKLPSLSPAQARKRFFSFVRAITGLIARLVLKAEKNAAKNLKFWQARPFTRLVEWGRDFKGLITYMEKNRTQARTRLVAWGFGLLYPVNLGSINSG